MGYIKEEHTLAWLQILLSINAQFSLCVCVFIEIRRWAEPGCKQMYYQNMHLKSFDLIENVNVVQVRKSGMK